jgi:hypothetical protein
MPNIDRRAQKKGFDNGWFQGLFFKAEPANPNTPTYFLGTLFFSDLYLNEYRTNHAFICFVFLKGVCRLLFLLFFKISTLHDGNLCTSSCGNLCA